MKPAAVIEFSNDHIKIVTAPKKMGAVIPQRLWTIDIANKSPDEAGRLLGDLIRAKRLKITRPVLSLSRDQITLRSLNLPTTNSDELKDCIDRSLHRQVPFKKEDVVWDYIVLSREVGYTKVILGIAHRDIVNKQFLILDKAKISPGKITFSSIGSFLFLQALMPQLKEKDGLNIVLLAEDLYFDAIVFLRDRFYNSKLINIAKESLSQPDAMVRLLGQIRQVLATITQAEYWNQKPSVIYILNNFPQAPMVKEAIAEEMGIYTELINIGPLIWGQSSKRLLDRPSAASLAGIAIKGANGYKMDFMPAEITVSRGVKQKVSVLILLVSSILYILLLISGIFFANLNYQQRYISHLQSELKKLKDENKKALEMFFSVNVISKHTNYDKSFLFYYNKLSNIMLHEVRFGSLEFIKNEGVNLRVEADDETYLSEFVDALNKDSLFKSVKTAYIRKHKEPDRPIAEFGLMCRM